MKRILVLWFTLAVLPAFAQIKSSDSLIFEMHGQGGYGSLNVSSGTAPSLMHVGAGATAAFRISDGFFAGISSDFNFVNQFSDPAASGGNFRATRWNIAAATLGIATTSWVYFADLEFLGSYVLRNTAADGGTVSYKSPLGARLRALTKASGSLYLGGQFEFLSFSTESNSTSGDINLSTADSRKNIWELGIAASFLF